MVIVVYGSLADGFRFIGPFEDYAHALEWAEDHIHADSWMVTAVEDTETWLTEMYGPEAA